MVDPRRTDTCELADLHLAILPGTDVALLHGLLHILLWEGWIDRAYIDAHTDGLRRAQASWCATTRRPAVAGLCGIDLDRPATLRAG